LLSEIELRVQMRVAFRGTGNKNIIWRWKLRLEKFTNIIWWKPI